jgi:hypothetical protein
MNQYVRVGIQDADVHLFSVQIDSAVIFVRIGIKFHNDDLLLLQTLFGDLSLEGSSAGGTWGGGHHKYQAHVVGLVFRYASNQPQMRALGEEEEKCFIE